MSVRYDQIHRISSSIRPELPHQYGQMEYDPNHEPERLSLISHNLDLKLRL